MIVDFLKVFNQPFRCLPGYDPYTPNPADKVLFYPLPVPQYFSLTALCASIALCALFRNSYQGGLRLRLFCRVPFTNAFH